jgi:hypothetical protein
MPAISQDQSKLSLRHNVQGTVYVLHFEPAYKHAQHYVGWTEGEVTWPARAAAGVVWR